MTDPRPVLYSFRRCPYAMRARLAIAVSGQQVSLREIVLRDKAPAFLDRFPTGTVPGLLLPDGRTIPESLDIMHWALDRNDPETWRVGDAHERELIAAADGPFKTALDHYKYASRHPEINAEEQRDTGLAYLKTLEPRLSPNLLGKSTRLADMAILPFVRQFAHVDINWFRSQPIPQVIAWLDSFLASTQFAAIMQKYPKWRTGDAVTLFPDPG